MFSQDSQWSLTVTVAVEQVTAGLLTAGRLTYGRVGRQRRRSDAPSVPGQHVVTQTFAIGDALIRPAPYFCYIKKKKILIFHGEKGRPERRKRCWRHLPLQLFHR